MVALMRFTRDICRLLGLGSEGPSAPRQEEIECGAATPDHNDDVTLSQEQDILSGEEGLSEEEKIKCRAERRRAKRKRRRERKKLEQAKKSENDEQDGEDEDGGAESELEESESEEEEEEDEEVEKEEQKEEKPAISRCKDAPVPPVVPPGTRAPQKAPTRPSEEEPEWDVSSAFFANAASHIRPKGWTKPGRKSKENKENEARTREVNADAVTKRSASLTEKGIKLVQEGQYSQAVSMFTEAIRYDPKDYRFFGNRSYCYSCLEKYPQALSDAERSIQLASDWPKGHFRKGSALIGMKRYSEAEKAMEQVLKLDKDCEEAVNDLFNCKVLQLMELGYEEMQSVLLLERYSTIQTVLASPEAARVVSQDSSLVQPGSPGPSLWVGNVTAELTEKHLWDLFKMYGEIDSIRVLHERFCAFVNFKNANMASRAMEKLNGYSIENTRLVVRYPDRRTQRVLPVPLKTSPPITQQVGAVGPRRRGPVNGDECYFWRTTGCHFGEKCRYKHIPEQLGKDRKPWQP